MSIVRRPPKGSFGIWLDDAIHKQNLSYSDFAKAVGFVESTVRTHICGISHPNMESIRKYAKYFGVSEYDLAQLVVNDVKSKEIGDKLNEPKD